MLTERHSAANPLTKKQTRILDYIRTRVSRDGAPPTHDEIKREFRLKSAFGGEVTQITAIIHEGRKQSYARMIQEAQQRGGAGITGVTSELRHFHGNIEFLSVASCVHGQGESSAKVLFSTSGDGQELYCQLDAGYQPLHWAADRLTDTEEVLTLLLDHGAPINAPDGHSHGEQESLHPVMLA